MVKSSGIEIINDVGLEIEYSIKTNRSNTVYRGYGKSRMLTADDHGDEDFDITVWKDDAWDNRHPTNFFLMILYSFDLMFGNMMESGNLPFAIHYHDTIKISEPDGKKIYLSQMIHVKDENVRTWMKISNLQLLYICLLVFLIGIVLCFLFPGWYKALFLFPILVLDIFVFAYGRKHRNAVAKCLLVFRENKSF